ncbi:MAG: histidinol-phosphate transaminase [Bacteroidetes bacterium]|nr:histidinol-phosphate transaminase [Bacteroidota bacterium]
MGFDLNQLIRPHIQKLVPYSSARDEFQGEASVFLDANENSIGSPLVKWYNRYPDPHQDAIRNKLSSIKGVPAENIFIGNGSDECIDLLYRAFCEPGRDNIIINPPTYGMYEVSANIQGIEIRRANLLENFQLDLEKIESLIDANTKIIWICSPNNPTGNSIYYQDIEAILNNFDGIVVADEAYINFARQKSMVTLLNEYPNLVVMQTLSKAWGLAGLRVGMAFALKEIIQILLKIKPPYNISEPVQELALKALDNVETVNAMIKELVAQRQWLENELPNVPAVIHTYPSDANFLLVKVKDATGMYQHLIKNKIVVRDRSKVVLCENALRITVGTEKENQLLIQAMKDWQG